METFCAAALEEGGQATGHDAAGGGGGRGARGAGGGSGSTVLGCLQGSTHRAGFGADCLGAVKAATAVQLSDMRADSALYSAQHRQLFASDRQLSLFQKERQL